jgi:hypothetical protein
VLTISLICFAVAAVSVILIFATIGTGVRRVLKNPNADTPLYVVGLAWFLGVLSNLGFWGGVIFGIIWIVQTLA